MSNASTTSVLETSRLIQDTKGKYMFIGDSADLSLLQNICSLVGASIGPCAFVEDPFRYQMVESAPEGPATWLHARDHQHPAKPSFDEAVYLIRRYIMATNCVLDLFDESDLLDNVANWLDNHSDHTSVLSAIYYLVFAIGAQTCPEDKDALAKVYFDYGRYLTASYFMEDPSIPTVQAYAMITMYLLGASRRNAAFMYLGTAVRAAYALGLHRSDIAGLFTPAEIKTRERVWKVMRILDLFMGASLGRPPSTEETRNTELDENYSPSVDLCAIFEKILTDIYAKRMISTDTVQKISQHHRRWTAHFQTGLDTDRIKDEEFLEGRLPNIGLIHVQEAYYWTIILLTRPFFVEYVSSRIALKSQNCGDGERSPDPLRSSHRIQVHACVNSAISTVNMLRKLLGFDGIPKRLPFVVNSIFVSGLVLGLSYFGDLYKTYPLDDSLGTALKLLALFSQDAVAKRNLAILESLLDACRIYVQKEAKENMAIHSQLVSGMFGQIHTEDDKEDSGTTNTPEGDQSSVGNIEDQLRRPAVFNRMEPHDATDQGLTSVSTVGSSGSVGLNTLDRPEINNLNLEAMAAPPTFQDDISMLPPMSPRTLWFGSYEDNVPLFSMIDARDFLE
ncbi:Fungal specific transcription factor domain-containing protein [Cladophialophora immunda]|nr:Fungal specific transcription factor domain-containing protein [Cladophialophora immunda]